MPTSLIPLSNGYIAAIDCADFARVSQFKWSAQENLRKDGSVLAVYAIRQRPVGDGTTKHEYLHRFILGIEDRRIQVDHKNHYGPDCRRDNLRVCTNQQNHGNIRIRANNTSGFKGVHWNRALQKWCAQITIDGRAKHLGNYALIEDAARAYNTAAKERFGEFACLNNLPLR